MRVLAVRVSRGARADVRAPAERRQCTKMCKCAGGRAESCEVQRRGVRVLRCVECAACGDVMARHGLCRLRMRRSGWWKRGGQGSGGAEREAGTEQAGRAATTYSGSMGSMGQAGRKGERVDNEDNSE